jgi:ketosteroid isomerase-like protein
MKRILSLALVSGLYFASPAFAQSAESQVESAVRAFYQHLNDADAASWRELQGSNYHGNFPRQGTVFTSGVPDPVAMQAGFDSGQTSYQLALHNLGVTVYGDTAVASFYTTGPSVVQGTRIEGTYRVTQVWVRQSGAWRMVHFHISPLVA